jgi:hypothetical protein
LQLCGRAQYRVIRKNRETEGSWTNPLNVLQEATLLLYKILHLLLFPLVRILHALRLESRKIYQHSLDVEPLEFQFLRQRGRLTKTLRTLSLCFGVIGKTPGLITRHKVVKKTLPASAIVARCDSISPFLRCQGVWNKTCTQLSLSQILYQNPTNYSVGMFKDSALILDTIRRSFLNQISNSCKVYLSSSRFWTATSIVIFYQLPSVSKSRIPTKDV